ncbi:MAG: hypothetical protein LBH40_00890 [Alphaproteobacteria bacterium]|jgi:hypothetical protein|nr:hypothetical protein [Alphaproteobacteria bacterium]
MDIVIFLKTIFSHPTLAEVVWIIIFTTIIVLLFVRIHVIHDLFTLSGVGIAFIILCFVTAIVKGSFLVYESNYGRYIADSDYLSSDKDKNSAENPALISEQGQYPTYEEGAESSNNNQSTQGYSPQGSGNHLGRKLDDGSMITDLPPNREVGKIRYTEEDVRNSLNKIVDDFGYEGIFYLQRVVLNARRSETSNDVILMKLEDYAFICSMNLCNRYFYDFNDLKDSVQREGFFLVLVVPEFIQGLTNFTNIERVQ